MGTSAPEPDISAALMQVEDIRGRLLDLGGRLQRSMQRLLDEMNYDAEDRQRLQASVHEVQLVLLAMAQSTRAAVGTGAVQFPKPVVSAQLVVTARRPRGPRRWLVDLTPDEARFVSLIVVLFAAIGVAAGRLPTDVRAGLDEVRDWVGFGLAVASLIVLQNRHRRPPQ